MARTLRSDKLLFWATLLLVGASIVMVYSATAVPSAEDGQAPYSFLFKQLAFGAVGTIVLLAVMRIDYHEYRRPALIWTLLAVTVVGLFAVFLFSPRNGTQRWILIGSTSIQPSELAKLAAIVFAAAILERRMHRVNEPGYALVPIGVVTIGLAALILRQPDFGTAAVLVGVVGLLVFVAGLSYRYLFGLAVVLLPAAIMLLVSADYRTRRLLCFLNPEQDRLGCGYQVLQSEIAVGSGGVLGRGLMEGVQKLFYLPEAHTDFIYAVIGEEFGLIGTTLILLCFVVIGWRGARTALRAPDRFGTLLAIGLTMMVALQAFVNISVVLGLLPTKGIPLPFVSNGGSSLMVNLVAVGVLLNVSQQGSPTAAAALEARG
jgi:cell division protein FtsW